MCNLIGTALHDIFKILPVSGCRNKNNNQKTEINS